MSITRSFCVAGLFLLLSPWALADSVTFGGYVDTYYGYDFDNPSTRDRAYTTRPSRHNEFNVNLTYLDARISGDRVRGRVALQAGTSVQANYASEPGTLSRHIQEATAGYQVNDKLWIDAGIFLSHIGFESWIPKDNWTYTPSMIADFSPYYETGVKASYEWSSQLSAQFLVLNGWQNIADNNGNKAVGAQIAYTPNSVYSFTYNNYYGVETGDQPRFFNDFIFKVVATDKLQFAASYDVGLQRTPTHTSNAVWQGYAVFARYQLTPKVSVTARGEQYLDKNQIIVVTNTPDGFQTSGGSLNVDVQLRKNLLWRNEVRGLWSLDNVFPTKTGTSSRDGVAVTSLALWF